jgi:mannonate dehydratase
MKETWRWFGPRDAITIDEIMQTESQGIVTALHHIPVGDLWSVPDIRQRQNKIAHRSDGSASGLTWDVVESLPVCEDIKRQTGDWRTYIQNYIVSLENLAECGLEVVCYNFMPLIDWTRTDLAWPLAKGGHCMRFDYNDFAVFDLHLLRRTSAAHDYSAEIKEEAARRFEKMSEAMQTALVDNVIAGLPGTDSSYTLDDLTQGLSLYSDITETQLRAHHMEFLELVVPTAERLGLRLCCHPDDPPFPLLGLPRIMSTEQDYAHLCKTINSPAAGITLCSGSLGALAENDLTGMMQRLGQHVHFIHLRNVRREANTERSFFEAAHLDGDTDMPKLIAAILAEEDRRRVERRKDDNIPFRPDHGQAILDDLTRRVQPGYPLIGRMKGLAELRGCIATARSIGTHANSIT